MKKLALGLSAAALMAGSFALPATADVITVGFIDKTEWTIVDEQIDILKIVAVNVFMGTGVPDNPETEGIREDLLSLDGAAEAAAYANIETVSNNVNTGAEGFPTDQGPFPAFLRFRRPVIDNSVLNNSGIVGVNQDVGDFNNQGNIVAFAYSGVSGGIAHSQAGADQLNAGNTLIVREFFPGLPPTPPGFDLTTLLDATFQTRALIEDSINMNVGIVGVNQNGGNVNNQTNSVAVAAGVNPAFALGDHAVGQINAGNSLSALNTIKKDEIINSVSDNVGAVVQVNQSIGHANNQYGGLSIAAGIAQTEITGLVN